MKISNILIIFILKVFITCSDIKEKLFKNIKKRTKFLLLNEPIVHISFSENLMHSLFYDLENEKNVYTLDEDLLNLKNLNHSSIFRLLVDTYKKIEENQDDRENIRYIFLATSFSRIHPLNLEYFLRKLNKYIYNESIYKKGNINIKEILNEYNSEIQKKMEEKEKIKNKKEEEHINIKDIENIIMNEKEFFLNNDDTGSDMHVIEGSVYKGLFIGYGFNDENPSIIHHYNLDDNFYFPYINSGVLMDITLLRNIYIKSLTAENMETINIDYIYEISKFINEKINVNLTSFQNMCMNDEKNIHLLDNDLSNFELYKYYQVLHLFKDYKPKNHKGNNGKVDQHNEIKNNKENKAEKKFNEKYEDDHLAELLLSYFNIFYPISTCISYSIRSKNESLIGYDKFHIMNLENDEKLKNYIKETENITYTDMDEYKKKLNRINNKYNYILDENENTFTYKNILIGIKTSINTEERIPYIKNTYDNQENTKIIFNNMEQEHKINEKNSVILNNAFLNSAFESENINIDIIYMSDKESTKYNSLYMNTSVTSKDGLCEKLKHMIFYFYENYIQKNSEKKYFFIADDDTFVNVKNLIDVMNLSLNECTHSKKYMYNLYLKSYKFLEENESFFLKNFHNKSSFLYEYLKNNFISTVNSLKKYDYVPIYCKNKTGRNNSTIPIFLGQRYSYNSFSEKNYYDYLTGGAGILINEETAKRIYFCENCKCPEQNSFMDDMILGRWAKQLKILAINFEGFFQNAPNEYNKKYLNHIVPITFHKLNKDKTVEETKENYFANLVHYNKNNDTKDSHVDYLDRNYKSMMDNIFHYLYYIKKFATKYNLNIIKMNKKIYNKMNTNKNYKQLFDLKNFFKNELEDYIHMQKNGTNKDKKKKKKKGYSNNYVEKKNIDQSDMEKGKNESESEDKSKSNSNDYDKEDYLNEYKDEDEDEDEDDEGEGEDEDEDEDVENEDDFEDYDEYYEYLEKMNNKKSTSNKKKKTEEKEYTLNESKINDGKLTNNSPKDNKIKNENQIELSQYENNYDEL